MLRRAVFLGSLVLGFCSTAAPIAAEAQQAGKVYRIGVLLPDSLPSLSQADPLLDAFRQGLRHHGYFEGQNLVIERRYAEGQPERFPNLVAELVWINADVIVTSGAPAAQAAKQATSTVPIVMAQINDPVGLGLVTSLTRPGGNVTGLANLHSELGAKQMELLKEILPRATRVAVPWNPANPGAAMILGHLQHAARALRLTLQSIEMRHPGEFDSAFATMVKERADAVLLPPDPSFLPHGKRIVSLAAANRLPTIFGWKELVEAGGLLAYGPSVPDLFKRAATYVDRILKGAKPGDLPVEQPAMFELVINLKTAKALGITIPPSLLARADRVIE
jgi:putative ABC transport system substrate-binding protein